ncbi:MAG: hypothetical protein GY823_05870 [Flavobacteriaceae bacterium]|nr:hypothetical protein [Flavobacteriaceae bacterium]
MVLYVEKEQQYNWKFYIKTLLIGIGGISVWRSLWLLQDVIFFPDDNIKSAMTSLIFGFVIFIITKEIRL